MICTLKTIVSKRNNRKKERKMERERERRKYDRGCQGTRQQGQQEEYGDICCRCTGEGHCTLTKIQS